MIYRVHEAGEELRITFSAEAGAALGLFDGAGVELKAVDLDAMPEGMRYATWEEVEPIQRRMHEEYRDAFRELAKGPGAPEE